MLLRSVLLGVLVLSFDAMAKPPTAEELEGLEHFKKATRLFNLTQYDAAIVEFETAYKLRDDPKFLYNIAQSYRLAGRLDKAIAFYRNYLRLVSDSPLRSSIETRIVEMEKAIAVQRAQATSPPQAMDPADAHPTPTRATEPPAATATPTTATPPPEAVVVATTPGSPSQPAIKGRVWVWGVVAAAVVVVVGAGVGIGAGVAVSQPGDAALDHPNAPTMTVSF